MYRKCNYSVDKEISTTSSKWIGATTYYRGVNERPDKEHNKTATQY